MAENDEILSMFFNDSFSSTEYVDAFLQSILGKLLGNQYDEKYLNEASNKCANLVSHIDYYTDELTEQLDKNLETLENAKSSVLNDFSNTEVKRIDYYVNILNNSVSSLHSDLASVNEKLSGEEDQVILNITQLKMVRKNLIDVLGVFELIHSILPGEGYEVKIEAFQNTLDVLLEDFKNNKSKEMGKYIDDLVNILPLFKNITHFYPIYRKFTNDLQQDVKT